MNVLALTVFVGFVLVTLFVLLWFIQACNPRSFSERDALLPLSDEQPRGTGKVPASHSI